MLCPSDLSASSEICVFQDGECLSWMEYLSWMECLSWMVQWGDGGGLNEHGSLNQTVPTVRVQDTEFACSRGAKYHHAKLNDA